MPDSPQFAPCKCGDCGIRFLPAGRGCRAHGRGAVESIQGLITNWIAALALLLPFGYAFGAGMVAAVNPCGFVMLPAYLSLYLGLREADFASRPAAERIVRGLAVGGSVSLGFILLFAL